MYLNFDAWNDSVIRKIYLFRHLETSLDSNIAHTHTSLRKALTKSHPRKVTMSYLIRVIMELCRV